MLYVGKGGLNHIFLTLSHLFDAIKADNFLKNNVAKGEIAHDEQFLLWPQCFQLYLTIKLSCMEIIQVFANMFSNLSAADLLYVVRVTTTPLI